MAQLLIKVMYHYRAESKYCLHAFVVMPDHFHVLLSVDSGMSVERAMQLIKGGFSYRAAKELGFQGEIWQKGFSEVRILNGEEFLARQNYIHENPVRAHSVSRVEEYRYSSAWPGYEVDQNPFAAAKAAEVGD
jgi:putative transposase